jgi:sialidase-1
VKFKIPFIKLFIITGIAILIATSSLFVFINRAIIFNPAFLLIIFLLILISMLVVTVIKKNAINLDSKKLGWLAITIAVISLTLFIIITLKSLIIDYFQPLTLSTLVSVLFIVGMTITLIPLGFNAVKFIVKGNGKPNIVIINALLVLFMVSGIIWANTQGYREFSNIEGQELFLFNDGEGGYNTFRIPAIVAIDKNEINQTTEVAIEKDYLIALAEGRKNSSHDIGYIDIVMKTSIDGGNTWSDLNIVLSYMESYGKVGKVGNPTILYDYQTAKINLIHMIASHESDFHYKTYNVQGIINDELSIDWGEPFIIDSLEVNDIGNRGADGVSADTIMVGPGKGIQLKYGANAGRLVIPCSNAGFSFAYFSDDGGLTWARGENASAGNECEIAELSSGELIMVSRDNTGCSDWHSEQYQRLSYSNDSGESWYIKGYETILKTPICMASIDVDNSDHVYISYPNDFFTRGNLSIAVSKDNGYNWKIKQLYNGASGYSCITINSTNTYAYILAEVGAVNYNEALVFLKVKLPL